MSFHAYKEQKEKSNVHSNFVCKNHCTVLDFKKLIYRQFQITHFKNLKGQLSLLTKENYDKIGLGFLFFALPFC